LRDFPSPDRIFPAPTELLSRGRAGGLVDLLSLLGASVYLDLSLKNDASLRPADEDGVAGLPPAVAKLESSYGPWNSWALLENFSIMGAGRT